MNNTDTARLWCETHLARNGSLQRDGVTWLCSNPTREDRNPSLSVDIQKRVFKDHGTGEDGTMSELASLLGVEAPEWEAEGGREERILPARAADKASDAVKLWESGRPATPDHPYLVRKHVGANGCREATINGERVLLVPAYSEDGHVVGCERIWSDGRKKHLGEKAGCFHLLGAVEAGRPVAIAEGYSTSAAIHEFSGFPTVCAFGAGNVTTLARRLREKHPDVEIVLAVDRDDAGERAIRECGAGFLPCIPDGAAHADWNDAFCLMGPDEARKLFDTKLESAREKAPLQPAKGSALVNWDEAAGALDGTGVRPIERFFGLFSKGQVSLVAGLSGSGKSLLMQSLAMAGADGTGLMGQSEPLKVLIIEGDACREVFADRCNAFGWKPHDNVRWIFCMEHPDVPFTTQSEDGRAALQKIIEDVRPDVVFIDSLSGVDAELDELDTQQMKVAFKTLRDLASQNNVAIVVLHHVRKSPAAFVDREPTLHDISGAGSATRFCYSIYAVWSEEIDGRRVNAVKSLKDWSEMSKSFSYAVGNDGDRKTVLFNLDETVVLAAKKQKPASRVLDAIASLVGGEFGADDIERASGASRASVSREVRKFVESKDLIKVAHGRSTRYRVSPYSRNLVTLSGVYKNDENNRQPQSYQGDILLIKNSEGKNDEKDAEPVISSENVTRKVMRRIDRSSARGDVLFSSNTLHEENSAEEADEQPVEAPRPEQGFSSRGASAPGPLVEVESFPDPLPLPYEWAGHGWIAKVTTTGNGERCFWVAKTPNGKPFVTLREPRKVAA